MAAAKMDKKQIKRLRDPVSNEMMELQVGKEEVIHSFYTKLYTPDAINMDSINFLFGSNVNRDHERQLTPQQQETIMEPLTLESIILSSKRTPKKSSPGSDGLPYEVLNILMVMPSAANLILEVYNVALQHGIFPLSWDRSLMCLIPKKGDLSEISNYRPISLVNTDAKTFTRLINQRIMQASGKIINNFQLGFIPGKYIAENAMITQLIMEDAASQSGCQGLGILLDQEKAYDRVDLTYLKLVLAHYGFPAALVNTIYRLFSRNKINIVVNGQVMSKEVHKARGLKQGDPLSCILYNLAIEPLLRSILDDRTIQGYPFQQLYPAAISRPLKPIKLLCYADDLLVFLMTHAEFDRLNLLLDHYSKASNAKINMNKVKALSLSGQDINLYWKDRLDSTGIKNTVICKDDSTPVTYLGFPLLQSTKQRLQFQTKFINKLRAAITPHSIRSISVLGKATVLNTLILSKCWYILRVTAVTAQFLKDLDSIVYSFVSRGITPGIKKEVIYARREVGGLGVISPWVQQHALYYRWLKPILFFDPSAAPLGTVHSLLQAHLQNVLQSSDLDISLLFPTGRTYVTAGKMVSTISTILQTMDGIPRKPISTMVANPMQCLTLPLPAVLPPPSRPKDQNGFRLAARLKTIMVDDILCYKPVGHYVDWRPLHEIAKPLRYGAQQLTKALYEGRVKFHAFFLKCFIPTPLNYHNPQDLEVILQQHQFRTFKDNLMISPATLNDTNCTSTYRQAWIEAHNFRPYLEMPIHKKSWIDFWKMSLTFVQRNVIYRIILNKIPCNYNLKQTIKARDSSVNSSCLFCPNQIDTIKHFFFTCSKKRPFWDNLIQEFLWPTPSIDSIVYAIYTLDFSYIKPKAEYSKLGSQVLIILALAEIWKSHWRFIFDKQPILHSVVLKAFKTSYNYRLQQQEYSPQNL
jgi:hypothetical protein